MPPSTTSSRIELFPSSTPDSNLNTFSAEYNENVPDIKANQEEDVYQRFADLMLASNLGSETTTTTSPPSTGSESKVKNNGHLEKNIEQDTVLTPIGTTLTTDSGLNTEQPTKASDLLESTSSAPALKGTTQAPLNTDASTVTKMDLGDRTKSNFNLQTETTTPAPTTTTPKPSAQQQPVTTTIPEKESSELSDIPVKSFLRKADEFIEKNIFNFRKFLQES